MLEHPALFRAHPELAEVRLRTGNLPENVRGAFDQQNNAIILNEKLTGQTKRVLLHEIQHAIQQSEGFARGSNRENGKWHVLLDAYRQVKDTPQYQRLQTPDERWNYVSEQIVQNGTPFLRQTAQDWYSRAAGETEARDTARRYIYSSEKRAHTRPDLSGEAKYSELAEPQVVDILREMGYSEGKIQEMMRGFQNGTEESRGAEEFGNLRGRTEADGRIGRRYHSAGARERGRDHEETYRTVGHSGSQLGGIIQGAEQDGGQTFERESLNIPYSLPDGRSLREYLNEQYRGEPITWTDETTGKRLQMEQAENGAGFPPTNAEEPAAAVPGAMTEEAARSKAPDRMQSTEQEDAAWEQYMPNGWQNLPIEQQIALSERAQKRAEQMAISLSEQLESDIKGYLHKTFGTYFSSLDERFAADIKKDVISASDFHHEHYNDDDISIAFQRVTLGRMGHLDWQIYHLCTDTEANTMKQNVKVNTPIHIRPASPEEAGLFSGQRAGADPVLRQRH